MLLMQQAQAVGVPAERPEVQPVAAPQSDREVRREVRRPRAWALAITGWATVQAERTPAPTAFQILPVTALCPEVLVGRVCQHREPGDRVSCFRVKACPGLDSGQASFARRKHRIRNRTREAFHSASPAWRIARQAQQHPQGGPVTMSGYRRDARNDRPFAAAGRG
jgi:hypothetical protein